MFRAIHDDFIVDHFRSCDMEDIECLICSSSIRETNSGFDICRACAAFFKRSQTSGKKYTCRQGTRICVFKKHEKFRCRSCRYDRCLEISMGSVDEMFLPSKQSILERIKTQYYSSVTKRVEEEKKFVPQLNLKPFTENEELYFCNIEYVYLLYTSKFTLLISILQNLIPNYDDLSENIKVCEFYFILIALILISNFNVYKYDRCMRSFITVFDLSDVDVWATFPNGIRNHDLAKSVQAINVDYMDILERLILSGGITETEFIAVIAILICQIDTIIDVPDGIQHVFDETRTNVFNELQEHYKNELKLHQISTRLGNIMTMNVALSELQSKTLEHLDVYSFLFNVEPLAHTLNKAINH